ncbi:ADP-ribosylglycohydrolase family protein [Myroides odoratimimus]|uniref:ADP-ribosylglycohydrolase family protein n=1 Tax=Myroides odoratimimus TaxID=76832 RepID=UPI003D2F944B
MLYNKIKGVFYGQAIGDALGLGTEFMSKGEVLEHYPTGLNDYSQVIQDAHRSRWKKGDWTDDTDQFLCICDSIISTGQVSEIAFAKELYKWYKGESMGIGSTVQRVVSFPQFLESPHKASELVWKMSGKRNAANGAIMRTAILGIVDYENSSSVRHNAENIAKVTHYDPRCVGTSVIISLLVARHLRYDSCMSYESLVNIAREYDERIVGTLSLAVSNDIVSLRLDDEVDMGYTLKTFSAAMWAYFNALTFEEGILSIVNSGGDADTNACVAGAILGAKFGYDAIPIHWINGLNKKDVLHHKMEEFMQGVKLV